MTTNAASWLDLEPHVHDAAAAAKVTYFLIQELLDSEHPLHPSGKDNTYKSLWIGCDLMHAVQFALTTLLVHTREAADTFDRLPLGKATVPTPAAA